MALQIVEFFGHDPVDRSPGPVAARTNQECPFIGGPCLKEIGPTHSRVRAGTCSVRAKIDPEIVPICPIRMYAHEYRILYEVAESAFGPGVHLIRGDAISSVTHDGRHVAVFGKQWGKELHVPKPSGVGGYYVDWILARLSTTGELAEFVAVEVQTMDCTGNYSDQRESYLRGAPTLEWSDHAGFDWENVNKRILPQLIYKGHVLRREPLCSKGLYFVTPAAVYQRIVERVGGHLLAYERQPGAITFRWYNVGPFTPGNQRSLTVGGEFTTTVDQVAAAFVSPTNLPPARVYEGAIRRELA